MVYNPKDLKILIIDDNEIDLDLLEAILNRLGFQKIIKCKSAENAIALIKEDLPDLFFIDIILPGINGGELRGVLKEFSATKDIPVVFISGIISKEEEKAMKGRLKSGEIIVAKPFSMEKIAEALSESLKDKTLHET